MGLLFGLVVWFLAWLATGLLLLKGLYAYLKLSDLGRDRCNEFEAAEHLNLLVLPSLGVGAFQCMVLFFGGHFVTLLSQAPMLAW